MVSEMTDSYECDRILTEYARRDREVPADFYAPYYPANLFTLQGQEAAVLWALRTTGSAPLEHRRVLDVGCGDGEWLGTFSRFGGNPRNFSGIELRTDPLAKAKSAYPLADLRIGDATHLPWPDESFDVVFQATVFTSILDEAMRRAVAHEMLRVLKPSGSIVWLDFQYDNPRNRNVRGVRRRRLSGLFPECDIQSKRITLAPPLTRRIVPWSWKFAAFLEMLVVLNTHLIAVIRPRGEHSK